MNKSAFIKQAARGDQLRKLLSLTKPDSGRIFTGGRGTPYFTDDLQRLAMLGLTGPSASKGAANIPFAARAMRTLRKETKVVPNPIFQEYRDKIREASQDLVASRGAIINERIPGYREKMEPLEQARIDLYKKHLAERLAEGREGMRVLRHPTAPSRPPSGVVGWQSSPGVGGFSHWYDSTPI